MTMLTRWEPFRQMDRLQRDLDVLWAGTLGRRGDSDATDFAVPCDVSEDAERFLVTMDAPGLDREALDVRVEDDRLTLRGKREIARDDKRPFHLTERRGGAFLRAFTLPTSVDAEKVSAEYREGVLVVSLPKRAEARPRRIEVKVK